MKKRIALPLICCTLLTACSSVDGWFGKDEKKPLPGQRVSVLQMQQQLEPDEPPADAAALAVPAPWANEFWPQAGGYPNHAMQNLAFNPGAPKLVWSADIGEGATRRLPLTAAPIVADGKVFAIDREQRLAALDMKSGKEIWHANVRKKDEKDEVIGGGVSYSRGVLYVTNGYNEVRAMRAQDGKQIWKASLPAPSRAAPTVMESRVFVTTLDNRLIALDAEKGAFLWDYAGIAETAGLVGAASPAAASGIVVPAFSSGELYALLVENGSVSWSENLTGQRFAGGLSTISDIKGLPVIDRDLVIAVSFGGRMVAVDQRTGQRVWQKDISSAETPWVAGGKIFVLTLNNEVLALARDSGAILWIAPLQRFEDPDNSRSSPVTWTGPVMAGTRLILASSTGRVAEISSDNGKIIRQWDSGYDVSLPPAIASGMLFMLADDGTLLAYQ